MHTCVYVCSPFLLSIYPMQVNIWRRFTFNIRTLRVTHSYLQYSFAIFLLIIYSLFFETYLTKIQYFSSSSPFSLFFLVFTIDTSFFCQPWRNWAIWYQPDSRWSTVPCYPAYGKLVSPQKLVPVTHITALTAPASFIILLATNRSVRRERNVSRPQLGSVEDRVL